MLTDDERHFAKVVAEVEHRDVHVVEDIFGRAHNRVTCQYDAYSVEAWGTHCPIVYVVLLSEVDDATETIG